MAFSLSGKSIELHPLRSLINILREDGERESKFVLFLGAGASKTSGVPTAREMISEWRKDYISIENDAKATGLNVLSLDKQHWHNTPEEYSRLFEAIYHKPAQRRDFIERSLSNTSPSWGYIYLTNLIKSGVFNTIFTTNFDDLLNEACYLYSESIRPIVCAHDSSIRYVRITSSRPKIIKLHGDFLFDNIKNTVTEIESLEKNMKEKFGQFASEFGFIFLGYSGGDKSVMDVLNLLKRQEGNFPHGIYWCVRSEDEISDRLRDLASDGSIEFIKITGFDEFCAELHEGLGLQQQEHLSDPYGCLSKRLDNLISSARIPDDDMHPIIRRDLEALAKKVGETFPNGYVKKSEGSESENPCVPQGDEPHSKSNPKAIAVPKLFLAKAALYGQRYKAALDEASKLAEHELAFDALDVAIRALPFAWDEKLASRLLELSITYSIQRPSDISRLQFAMLDLMKNGRSDFVISYCDAISQRGLAPIDSDREYYLINWGQAFKHAEKDLPEFLKNELEAVALSSSRTSSRFGANIVLEKFDDAIRLADNLIADADHSPKQYLSWPIVALMPDPKRAELAERFKDLDSDEDQID